MEEQERREIEAQLDLIQEQTRQKLGELGMQHGIMFRLSMDVLILLPEDTAFKPRPHTHLLERYKTDEGCEVIIYEVHK